jgi:hypothetical protein
MNLKYVLIALLGVVLLATGIATAIYYLFPLGSSAASVWCGTVADHNLTHDLPSIQSNCSAIDEQARAMHGSEELSALVECLKLRNACVEEYQAPRNIKRAVEQARAHLRVLEDLEAAKKRFKEPHERFFDTAGQSYKTVKKKLNQLKESNIDQFKNGTIPDC